MSHFGACIFRVPRRCHITNKYFIIPCSFELSVTDNTNASNVFIILHLFYPEDGGDTFLRNTGNQLQDYTALQPRRRQSEF
jgi:hypothetical protein